VRNHDGGAVGFLKNLECDLPEEFTMSSESLEAQNKEIRLFGKVGNRWDNPRTSFNANGWCCWDFISG
jgi:hypothetical protein